MAMRLEDIAKSLSLTAEETLKLLHAEGHKLDAPDATLEKSLAEAFIAKHSLSAPSTPAKTGKPVAAKVSKAVAKAATPTKPPAAKVSAASGKVASAKAPKPAAANSAKAPKPAAANSAKVASAEVSAANTSAAASKATAANASKTAAASNTSDTSKTSNTATAAGNSEASKTSNTATAAGNSAKATATNTADAAGKATASETSSTATASETSNTATASAAAGTATASSTSEASANTNTNTNTNASDASDASATPATADTETASATADTAEAPFTAVEGGVLEFKPPIVVRDFAVALGLKPFQLISKLMAKGIFASVNQTLGEKVAEAVAKDCGFELQLKHRGTEVPAVDKTQKKKKQREARASKAQLEPRAPIVCVLGHVDHGKTTLLDKIRSASVAASEAGGITQHVGAYQVEQNGRKITFLDTPGHAAFSKMRERGAYLNDVAVLVVAADDGFMPQTDEALKFIKAAGVTPVVAINKMDAKGADANKVRQQMQERDILPEDWGGEVLCCEISALKAEGVEALLEALALQAELLELKADAAAPAEGVVVESHLERGRGSTATVIVQEGTLRTGDSVVAASEYCKVKAMLNEHGEKLKQAGPSVPVQLMGWSAPPKVGVHFEAAESERAAKAAAEAFKAEAKAEGGAGDGLPSGTAELDGAGASKPAKASKPAARLPRGAFRGSPEKAAEGLEDLMAAIEGRQNKLLKVVVKADAQGSLEALVDLLGSIDSEKVDLELLGASVGLVTLSDVDLAASLGASIVAFHTGFESGARARIKRDKVRVVHGDIIYELYEGVRELMAELLEVQYREERLGLAELRVLFTAAKGQAAGCKVSEGIIRRDAKARLLRKKKVIFSGSITTLKRFKEDVQEVRSGFECGIQLGACKDYQVGDFIEAYELVEQRASL